MAVYCLLYCTTTVVTVWWNSSVQQFTCKITSSTVTSFTSDFPFILILGNTGSEINPLYVRCTYVHNLRTRTTEGNSYQASPASFSISLRTSFRQCSCVSLTIFMANFYNSGKTLVSNFIVRLDFLSSYFVNYVFRDQASIRK